MYSGFDFQMSIKLTIKKLVDNFISMDAEDKRL